MDSAASTPGWMSQYWNNQPGSGLMGELSSEGTSPAAVVATSNNGPTVSTSASGLATAANDADSFVNVAAISRDAPNVEQSKAETVQSSNQHQQPSPGQLQQQQQRSPDQTKLADSHSPVYSQPSLQHSLLMNGRKRRDSDASGTVDGAELTETDYESSIMGDASGVFDHKHPASVFNANSARKRKGKQKEGSVASSVNGDEPGQGGGSASKKKKTAGAKRQQNGEKKKKAGRACAACQKAHLTCDDGRPCARCIKKGCADTCHDGVRKKAKYLQEVPDELLDRRFSGGTSKQSDVPSVVETSNQQNVPPAAAPASFNFDEINFYDTSTFANEFGSENANLEYAVLSSMLNGHGFPSGTADPLRQLSDSSIPSTSAAGSSTTGLLPGIAGTSPGFDPAALPDSTNIFAESSAPARPNQQPQFAQPAPPPAANAASPNFHEMSANDVYRNVTKPYPYAQSYHYLVRHLKDRFEKNDILRIIRALATFRPSLIALQMPLSEEDEIFVERAFQRTLVELNKLISFSGTPTVVWRRTGEICLVGTEFCLLTGWRREDLLGGKKYIFEIFDTSSVVEYYEHFAKHAFESTSSSVMTQAVVLGPSGKPVPCAFSFSVRRDLFSLPFCVIGSFLPILM